MGLFSIVFLSHLRALIPSAIIFFPLFFFFGDWNIDIIWLIHTMTIIPNPDFGREKPLYREILPLRPHLDI